MPVALLGKQVHERRFSRFVIAHRGCGHLK